MRFLEALMNKNEKLSVIGLGYVGMPLAVAFSSVVDVIGFDINIEKIDMYKLGIDPTNEIGSEKLKNSKVHFTYNEADLKKARFHIVAVPTPINLDKTPDLNPVVKASELLAQNLQKGSYVVYESTVYPGVTEDVCVPILEKYSGLKCGVDFKVGYSPERINPGDKIHTLENIVKIVSGMDAESLDTISSVYNLIIKAGIHKVKSIKVAEAAKVAENSQRDINIAFMNELAMVFSKMGIDTQEVIGAMNTKWNALKFYPGLVGGHCIGVDPYYFIYQAEQLGYHSQIILSGRQINDSMGTFITEIVIKKLIMTNRIVKSSKVGIFGITFKENTPDIRNSKVVDIYTNLLEYGIKPLVVDPCAGSNETYEEYGIYLTNLEDVQDLDCAIFAVSHKKFKDLSLEKLASFFNMEQGTNPIIIDVKSIFNKGSLIDSNYIYWSL